MTEAPTNFWVVFCSSVIFTPLSIREFFPSRRRLDASLDLSRNGRYSWNILQLTHLFIPLSWMRAIFPICNYFLPFNHILNFLSAPLKNQQGPIKPRRRFDFVKTRHVIVTPIAIFNSCEGKPRYWSIDRQRSCRIARRMPSVGWWLSPGISSAPNIYLVT